MAETTTKRPTPPASHYETLVIADPTFEKEQMDQFMEKYDQQIQRFGGTLQKTTEWGKRRLAYEIKKQVEGFYFLVEFEGTGDLVKKCDNYLNLQSNILRHLTVKRPAARKAPAAPPAP
jgi:small subunit ribosomal protein S6